MRRGGAGVGADFFGGSAGPGAWAHRATLRLMPAGRISAAARDLQALAFAVLGGPLLLIAIPARADQLQDSLREMAERHFYESAKALQEARKPITDRTFFTFRELLFGVDEQLCRQFVGTPGNFKLPDWRPATNVMEWDIVSRRPRPVGYWVYLDVANNGNKIVVYAENYGEDIRGGQTPILFDMAEQYFEQKRFEDVGLAQHAVDVITFRQGGRLAPRDYTYNLQHQDASAFRNGIAPEMATSDYNFVSPVLIDGATYFVVRPSRRGRADQFWVRGLKGAPPNSRYVGGLLFEYVAPGKVHDLCYFLD